MLRYIEKQLISEGYDGIIVKGDTVDGVKQDVYVVFEASQIAQPTPAAATETAKERRTIEKQQAEKEGEVRAVAKTDPRLAVILAKNLYSGDVDKVIVKELIQNANDALMAAQDPSTKNLNIEINTSDRHIRIEDDGVGMTPEIMQNQFVDYGGSEKAEGSAGGFGLAKFAILGNSRVIHVESTALVGGEYVTTILDGSGKDWANPEVGLQVTIKKGITATTGTTLDLKLYQKNEEGIAEFSEYKIRDFLDTFGKKSGVPYETSFEVDGREVGAPDVDIVTGEIKKKRVGTEGLRKVPGAVNSPTLTADVYASDELTSESKQSIEVDILNHGIYQFSKRMYMNGEAKVPTEVVVDIKAKLPPTHDDYPFDASREHLKWDAEKAITRYLQEKLVSEQLKEQQATYQKAFKQAPKIKGVTKRLVDATGQWDEDLFGMLAQADIYTDMSRAVESAFKDMMGVLGDYVPDNSLLEFYGFALARDWLGVHIPGSYMNRSKTSILVNLSYIWSEIPSSLHVDNVPEFFAGQVIATLVHEISHQKSGGHSERYAGALTRVGGRTILQQAKAAKAIAEIVRSYDHGELNKFFTEQYSRTAGSDLLGKIASGQVGEVSAEGEGGSLDVDRQEGGAGRGEVTGSKDWVNPKKVVPKAGVKPTSTARASIIKQAHTIKSQKGLTDKYWKELKRAVTKSGKAISMTKMSDEELEAFLKKVKRARPKTVNGKTVITRKTEKQIAELKKNLKAKLHMTDEAFAEILKKEIGKKEPRYIDADNFITQSEGREIIHRMHDASEVLRVTQARDEAVAASPTISKAVKALRERIAAKPKRDPYRLESMRYYAQQSERVTGAPIHAMYNDIINVHNVSERTRHARMAALEAAVPGFKEIAGDEEALDRVARYIASQSNLKDKPARPADMSSAELKLAKEIQKIGKEYENMARVNKFFNWYYTGEGIAEYDQFKKEIEKAKDIYDTQGREELEDYLKTQTWGVIKSGYEPLESFIWKVKQYETGPKTVGKSHIKIRTDIEYHKQERNILQRLNSYMRQMDMLYNLRPKINAFVRLYEDNAASFAEPKKVTNAIEVFLRNLKKYNVDGSWWGDLMARVYAQVSQVVIMSQPVLAFRNLFQNPAFEHDKTILFDPRNEPMTPEDVEYRETHVQQLRGMMEEYFLINEKSFPGLKTLTKWLKKIRIYGWSDVTNRDWSYWAKMNQVRRAQKAETLEDTMKQARFEDLTLEEQVMALEILAAEGDDAMARYVARMHVADIHFQYERAQRSPAEQDKVGRVLGNLMLFPRAYGEKMARAAVGLKSKDATEQRRAAKRIVAVMAGGYIAGTVYMMITGRRRNPYDPFGIIQVSPGGLVLGATTDLFDIGALTIRALTGDKTAMYALTSELPNVADNFIPFYKWTLSGLEAVSDTKNIDKQMLREIYGLIDKEYKARGGAYKMERDFVDGLRYVLAGPGVDVKEKKKTTKRQTFED